MTTSAPLLVVSHEASRTGAPQVLAVLLEHLVPTIGRPVVVRQLAGGVRFEEFARRATMPDGDHEFGAVVINSVVAVRELARVRRDVPALVYIHEEGRGLEVVDAQDRAVLADRADVIYTVSATGREQVLGFGVSPERVQVVPPPVVAPTVVDAERDAILERWGDAPLLIGCGLAGWRKGTDLFAEIVAGVARTRSVRALWVGRVAPIVGARVLADAHRLGIADRLHLIGEVSTPGSMLAAADVVLAPSREDPQPLVPAEAALVGTPTVGFDLGGVADYAASGFAAAVPFPDVTAFVAAVNDLLDHGGAAMAQEFADWLRRERSADVVVSRLRDDLSDLIGEVL